MAVYTKVEQNELIELLNNFNIGELKSYAGITAGITNTNYKITTDQGDFVLTILEHLSIEELEPFTKLTEFLTQHNFPCPQLMRDQENRCIYQYTDKPAILMSFLPGEVIQQANSEHCYAVGDALGKLHSLTANLDLKIENTRGATWRSDSLEILSSKLPVADAILLQEEIGFHKLQDLHLLPKGIIHADLFQDNVLFTGTQITGVVDFYYACYDDLLLDLAIAVNTWCKDAEGKYQQEYIDKLIAGYEQHRQLTDLEWEHWVATRRTAALRFWISRCLDYYFPTAGEIVTQKNPDEYKQILQHLSTIPNI